ncbi:MAG: bifunctional pyr operon transcriptional regulator/uracil phosphoribosyltransferase PyrR [Clostridia bacterium]|nr:bifunctional pyr operon transcriptional regulator/uracil phosphoribosyltransferase PyrR [Clostridia bacterium]
MEEIVKSVLMDREGIRRTITRMAHEIVEHNDNLSNIVFIGVKTRGIALAKRLQDLIFSFENIQTGFYFIDISSFRDDDKKVERQNNQINLSSQNITGKDIILVDDVLYTGRTSRAAMEAIISIGRPKSIQLAVLVDRGHRELPIRADYVGKNVPTSHSEKIKVFFDEFDGEDKVLLLS